MRRIAVVLVLLGGMLGLKLLKADPISVGDPLTLAAIGFVVLAAFTVAEIGQVLKLPLVTGYIVTGIVLGPYALNILSRTVVEEMRIFNTLALGLIATAAGLELDLRGLARVWRTLFSTTVVKLFLVCPSAALVFYVLESKFGFLGLTGGAVVGLALLMGTFAIGTSPSVTLAVLSETRAKGRLTDLVLGAAVLKDLIEVVLLSITVAITISLISPGATLGPEVLTHIAKELGYTVIVGAALGGLLILYIRFVKAEMLLFTAAMILVVAELSHALHLELLLVFIVAGFVVRNFSHFEHELHEPLQMVSLPVFIVFFTIAGASVNLTTLVSLLPLALALSAVRAGGFWIAARAGGAIGGETPLIRKTAWLSYLPLAGVTLGLIGLASARIPALSEEISSLGLAFVAINLLIGPVTLRTALSKVGEIPEPRAEEPKAPTSVVHPEAAPAEVNVEKELAAARALLQHSVLENVFDRAQRKLSRQLGDFAKKSLDPWAAGLKVSAKQAVAEGEKKLDALRAFAESAPSDELEHRAELIQALFDNLQQRQRSLPAVVEVPMQAEDRRILRTDSFKTRWRKRRLKWLWALTFGRAQRVREVPMRMVARTALEPRLAQLASDALADWNRAHASVLEELRRWAANDQTADETRQAIDARLSEWRERFTQDTRRALVKGLFDLARMATLAGGPALPAREIRYSNVEPKVRELLDGLPGAATAWAAGIRASHQTLILWVNLAAVDAALDHAVQEDVRKPLGDACSASLPTVELVRDRLLAIKEQLSSDDTVELEPLLRAAASAYPASAQAELRRARARFARTAAGRDLSLELRALVDTLPQRLLVLRPGTSVHRASSATDFGFRSVNLRSLADQKLLGELLPIVDSAIADIATRIATASAQIRECVEIAVHALEFGLGDEKKPDRQALSGSVGRAAERLDQIRKGLEDAAGTTRTELQSRADALRAELRTVALGQPTQDARFGRVDPVLNRFVKNLGQQVAPLWNRARASYRRITEDFRRFYGSELSRDIQIRFARTVLDARAIRNYLAEWSTESQVPAAYARLFQLEPLRDRRFFVANRAELDSLLASERAWQTDGPSSALIVGAHGSGRTSMLNLCQLELMTRRVLRPDWTLSRRELGIVPVLADDLGCESNNVSLRAALTTQRTVVLVDDLLSWFTPDASGLARLEKFLELVVMTRRNVFWIVTIEQDTLANIEQVFSIRQAFGHVLQIHPASAETLVEMIETRHRLSGFDIEYPRTFASQFLRRFRGTSERAVFFRLLSGVTEGNLRLTLLAFRRSATLNEANCIVPSLPRVLTAGLPFVPLLPPRPASMLVQVVRFGPLDPERLAAGSGLERGEGARNTSFLESAGLLQIADQGRTELTIPLNLQEVVIRGLREMGALRPGGAR